MIHNAEIHIVRADPSKHDGRAGFLYGIRFGSKQYSDQTVWATRAEAAHQAAYHLDAIEEREAVR